MSAQNVRALSTINKQIPEVKNLMNSVDKLPWNLKVPLIVQTLGLGYSIDSRLLSKDQVLPRGSIGRKMGFSSLGDVISTPASEGGLGIEWDDWISDIKAYHFKKAFGIYFESRDDVLTEYQSVSDALGHAPVTLDEYAKARDEIFRRQYARRENELLDSNKELENKVQNAEFEKRHVEQKYSDTVQKMENLKETLEETKTEYEAKLRYLEAENERAITEAQDASRKATARRYYGKIKHLKSAIEQLEENLKEARRQKSKAESKNASLSTVIEDLNSDLHIANTNLKVAEETIARQEEVIARYEQTIDELSDRVDQVSTETGIIALEEALKKNKERVIRLNEKLKTAHSGRKDALARLSRTRRKMSSVNIELQNKKYQIRKKEREIAAKNRAIASHRTLRNFLIFTTVASLGLLSGLSYLMA